MRGMNELAAPLSEEVRRRIAGEIVDAIGRRSLCDDLDVGATAVSNAVVKGQFPASWYLVIAARCADLGLDCPSEIFNMRRAKQEAAAGREDCGDEERAA